MMFPSEKEVESLRKRYPAGTRIQLDRMGDDPHPIAPGTNGTVKHVDDIGTVHCVFDNGRSLGLVPGEDSFHALPIEKEVYTILEGIDEKRDAFWVFPDWEHVQEIYYNPDSSAGGQFVFNYFSFDLILEAEKECGGDPGMFFDHIQDLCYQELVDIDCDPDTVGSAAETFMMKADMEGYTLETMNKLINAAHACKERQAQKQTDHER